MTDRPWARLNPSPCIFSAGCSKTPRRAMEQHIYVNSSAQIIRALSAFPRPIGGTFTSGQATPRYGEPGTEAPTGQAREHARARSDPNRTERYAQSRSLPLPAPTAIGEGVCPRPGDAQLGTGKSNTVPPGTGIAAAVVPCDGEAKPRHPVRVHHRGRRNL